MTTTTDTNFHRAACDYYEACFGDHLAELSLVSSDDIDDECEALGFDLESILSIDLVTHAPYGNCQWAVLLTTGGPAARVLVHTDEKGDVCDAVFQYQDWFQPWYAPENQDRDLLIRWASMIYLHCPYCEYDRNSSRPLM